jgi:hypothetical protein
MLFRGLLTSLKKMIDFHIDGSIKQQTVTGSKACRRIKYRAARSKRKELLTNVEMD